MRLGVVAYEHPPALGGMERLAAMHIRHLAARHELLVFTHEDAGDSALPDVTYRSGLTGRTAPDAGRLSAETVDGWLFFNAGLAPCVPHLRVPAVVMVHGNDFLRPWLPNLGPLEILPARAARKLSGQAAYERVEKNLRRRRIAKGLNAAAGIVANSRFTQAELSQLLGSNGPPMTVIHPGLEDHWFAAPLNERGPAAPLRLLSVCRLTTFNRRKNVEGVMEAVALLRGEIEVVYDVVGDGDDRKRLAQRAVELGIADRVQFLGPVSNERLRRVYAEADLFVMVVKPVPDDVEGFGMVYTEAAALGAPSLAARLQGATDAVDEGVSGLLLDSAEPAAIADAIRHFAANRSDFDPARVRGFAETLRIGRVGDQLEQFLLERLRRA